jgi:hypothetical protein
VVLLTGEVLGGKVPPPVLDAPIPAKPPWNCDRKLAVEAGTESVDGYKLADIGEGAVGAFSPAVAPGVAPGVGRALSPGVTVPPTTELRVSPVAVGVDPNESALRIGVAELVELKGAI